MIYSVKLREMMDLAKAYDDKLSASDPRFSRTVSLSHEDGSFFRWSHAFAIQKDNWIIIFSEHHGYHIYDRDEILDLVQFGDRLYPLEDFVP